MLAWWSQVVGVEQPTEAVNEKISWRGHGAGGEDVPAGGQVPADSRVAELPGGTQKHDRRVDQEDEDRERWREPTPDGRGRSARRRGAPALPSRDGLPLRAHPRRCRFTLSARRVHPERPDPCTSRYRSALAGSPDTSRRRKITFVLSW